MNVVAVRAQQTIADKSPRSFASRPRSEELDRITVRLRPAAVALERFVKPPPQITLSFSSAGSAAWLLPSPCFAVHRFIPTLFPNIHADSADGIDIGGAAHFVMSEDARPKKQRHRISSAKPGVHRKPFQDCAKLIRQLASA